jgi:hypothetical protein
MPALDYHPLRLRSVLPGSAHLGDLESRAAARTLHGRNASDVEAYLAEIRQLLEARAHVRGEMPTPELIERTALDEALRISKALQWARSAPRVVRVPSAGPPSSPPRGTLRVGGIQLSAPCVYVAFSDDFPTEDPDVRIAGVYLGEGGSLEALASGWVEYLWALAVAVQRTGEPLGSATASWHTAISTADPTERVSEALVRSFSEGTIAATGTHFGPTPPPAAAWHAPLANAIECALLAASHSCVANVVPRPRGQPATADAVDLIDVGSDDPEDADAARPDVHGAVARPRTPAEVVFGPAPPRSRNRWLVEREPTSEQQRTPTPTGRRPTPPHPNAASARKVVGHERGPFDRIYHRGTSRQFERRIAAHPVNGGRPKDQIPTVIVDRLDPGCAPSPRVT